MSYFTYHHSSYWFQLRVPVPLVPRYGRLLRINLQTQERPVAQYQSFQLAGQWLARFQAERSDPGQQYPLAIATNDVLVNPAVPPQPAPKPTDPVTPTLVGPGYADLYQAWKRIDPDRDSTILREMRSIADQMKSFCKKTPGQLQRVDVARFRDHLGNQRLARGTIAKKIGFISTLLQAGYDAGLVPSNVARGLRVPKGKIETLVRRSYSTSELERLMASSLYTSRYRPVGGGGEAAAWLPLIALATGARLEEIAQLRVEDLILDRQHGPLMRITDEGEGQQLKTESSRRIIPIHPQLIDAGLLRYADLVREARHDWLFPELVADHDGRRGANFGKWFQRYLRDTSGLGILDPAVVYHSFRHTFKTFCRAASIDEEVSDTLTGHAPTSIGRTYGEMPLSRLVPAIRSLVFPVAFPIIQD
ncbi:tyrosine-type recombinase/integrase [Propionivibrio sp.]|uniref:tyrosine-type recombinase/integrase n=1 Tax=Propionivibrio sp. TaxID=2212460 RepID=UPI003BF45609